MTPRSRRRRVGFPATPTLAGPNTYRSAGALRINTQADVDGGGSAEGTIERVIGDQFTLGAGVVNWSHRGDFGFLFHLGIPKLRSDGVTLQTPGGAQACIGLGVYGGNGLLIDVYDAGYGINVTQMASGVNNGYGMLMTAANELADGAKALCRLAGIVADNPILLEIVGGVGPVNPSANAKLQQWRTTIGGVGGITVGTVFADTGKLEWNKDVNLAKDAGAKIGMFGAVPVIQPAAIASPSGGATVDTECRAAVASLLTALRNLGTIAT